MRTIHHDIPQPPLSSPGQSASAPGEERGFSLILVLVALVVITLVATATVYTSGSEQVSAQARERAALARQVAEAGLTHYAIIVQPKWIENQVGAVAGGGGGSGGDLSGLTYTDVLEGKAPIFEGTLPIAPPGLVATYVVWGGAPIDDGAQIILEGRLAPVDDPTRIVGRSRISSVMVMTSGSDGYSGTIGWTPRNTGVIGGGADEGYAGW